MGLTHSRTHTHTHFSQLSECQCLAATPCRSDHTLDSVAERVAYRLGTNVNVPLVNKFRKIQKGSFKSN